MRFSSGLSLCGLPTRPVFAFAFAAVILTGSNLFGGIVNSSGVTLLGGYPPINVYPGTHDTLVPLVFPEVINGIVPAGGMPVDHDGSVATTSPVTSTSVVSPWLVSSVIPAGTHFDSYMFHFDPATGSLNPFYGDPEPTSIEFSTKIIGIQLFTSNASLFKPFPTPYVGTLEAGDAVIAANGGAPAIYYPQSELSRGLEEDFLGVDLGGYRVLLQGVSLGSEIDQVRILVASPVPEPTTGVLAAAGLLALIFSGITNVGRIRRS